MAATTLSRIERLKRLEALVTTAGWASKDCPDVSRLLAILGNAYGEASNDKARRRALQRDLEELVQAGRVEVVNPKGKPLRYQQAALAPDEDPIIWGYTLRQIQDLVAGVVPKRQWDRLWQRLLTDPDGRVLDETRLRILPDTLRLQPVELKAAILGAVIEALAGERVLRVEYEDADGVCEGASLHPQALVQRGPIPYLFALKNDETEPVRLYALHRMLSAQALAESARPAPRFNLDQAIAQGQADFGRGNRVDLDLRVRGYLVNLLIDCPLAPGQRWVNEPPGSDFAIRLQAPQVPSTGQLLRWLLGAGDNLEVVAPLDLRRVMAAQARKMAALYAR